MNKLNDIWLFVIRYKYACILLFFALLIGVLDENSLMHRAQLQSQIAELQQEIRVMRNHNNRDSLMLLSLDTDVEAVRRVAREHYYMKRASEDVFVVVDTAASAMLRKNADADYNVADIDETEDDQDVE